LLERGRALSQAEIVRLMGDVLAGLSFSHRHGVVHRDIKPGNVMLTSPDIGRAQAKIADFGIARIESSTLTQAGTMMGTPAYMAPEQFLGEAIDARSDVYAAGVLLYQLLTGQRPFEGSISAIMHQVLTTDARPPSLVAAGVAPGFDDVVLRAIAKRPVHRFQTADDFIEALRAAEVAAEAPDDGVDETILEATAPPIPAIVATAPAPTGTAAPAATDSPQRLPLLALGLGLLIAAGIGGTLLLTGVSPDPAAPPVTRAPAPVADRLTVASNQGDGGSGVTPGDTAPGREAYGIRTSHVGSPTRRFPR
jgi:serine/threonine-protein kinase